MASRASMTMLLLVVFACNLLLTPVLATPISSALASPSSSPSATLSSATSIPVKRGLGCHLSCMLKHFPHIREIGWCMHVCVYGKEDTADDQGTPNPAGGPSLSPSTSSSVRTSPSVTVSPSASPLRQAPPPSSSTSATNPLDVRDGDFDSHFDTCTAICSTTFSANCISNRPEHQSCMTICTSKPMEWVHRHCPDNTMPKPDANGSMEIVDYPPGWEYGPVVGDLRTAPGDIRPPDKTTADGVNELVGDAEKEVVVV